MYPNIGFSMRHFYIIDSLEQRRILCYSEYGMAHTYTNSSPPVPLSLDDIMCSTDTMSSQHAHVDVERTRT